MTLSNNPIEDLSQLLDELSVDVLSADQGDLTTREELFGKWLSNPVVVELLAGELSAIEADVQRQIELMAVGLAGLARTVHVGANQGLFTENQPTETEIMLQAGEPARPGESVYPVYEEQDRRLADIDQVHQVYDQLDIPRLAPWTIHHDGEGNHHPIDWQGEIAQDQAQTFIKTGHPNEAIALVEAELDRIDTKLSDVAFSDLRWHVPDSDLRVLDFPVYRLRKRYLGLRSAKAVLHLRLAKATQSIGHFQASLNELLELQTVLPQADRLAVVAKQAALATVRPGMEGTIEDRVRLGLTALPVLFNRIRQQL